MATSKTQQTKQGGGAKRSTGGGGAGKRGGASGGGGDGGRGGGKAAPQPKGDGGDRNVRLGDDANRLFMSAGGIGLIAMGISLSLGFTGDLNVFLHSYTVAFMWILAITLGGLWWVTLQHLVGASWSVVARRVGELIAMNMPLMALLSLPIVVPVMMGKGTALFPWSDAHLAHTDHVLHHKAPYLNTTFFLVRCAIYFGFWSLLARYFFRTSVDQDRTPRPEQISKMRAVSAPSMIAIALTLTFCAIDFMMSQDKLFFSTIFGVYYFAGCVICINSTLALVFMWLQSKGRLVGMITVEHYHDLGKMMFAFVIFWSYIAFSQFMLIWYANIPEETQWFKPRFNPGWNMVSLVLLLGHFALPFLGLLSRHVKRHRAGLAFWAIWLLVVEWVDLYWLIMPQLDPNTPPIGLVDITSIVAVTALSIAGIAFNARNVNLVPMKDPRLPESLAFENI